MTKYGKELTEKYAAISDAIVRLLIENGIQNYMVGFLAPEGPVIVGLFGHPVLLSMIHLQLGNDILDGLKETMGIPKDSEEPLNVNTQSILDKKKMN